MLTMKDAFRELETCYAGLRSHAFFQGSHIHEHVLNIDASSYSKKLNGHRKFVARELSALARYFDLGDNGMELFLVDSPERFREELITRGIGKYATAPAVRLNSRLWDMAVGSDAKLDFHRLEESPVTRGGFELLPTTEPDDFICLSKGTTTQFQFSYPVDSSTANWFLLMNYHIDTESINILNPTHEEDTLALKTSPVVFPSAARVKIHRDTHLGHHRLYGLSLNDPQISVVFGELARLRHMHHGQRSAESIAINTGQLTLDQDAVRRIHQMLENKALACAALDYTQV